MKLTTSQSIDYDKLEWEKINVTGNLVSFGVVVNECRSNTSQDLSPGSVVTVVSILN